MIITQQRGFNRGVVAQTGALPAGLRLLQDTYPLELREIKEVMSESAGVKKPVLRMTGVFQKADEKNQNGRIYSTPILAEAVEAIQKDLGNRSVLAEYDHPCLKTSDFRVLAVDGWKEFKDIKIGDYVWSRVNGQMVKSRVNQIINEEYDGPVYDIFGRNINIGFTPGHRLLLTERRTQKQLYATVEDIYSNRKSYAKSPIPRTAKWIGIKSETMKIPGIPTGQLAISANRYNNDITQDLVLDIKLFTGFLGLYLAEGNLHGVSGIQINQKTIAGRAMVKTLLDQFPPELIWVENATGYYLSDLRLHTYLAELGDKYNKYIPSNIKQLDSESLEYLVYWFAVGNGQMLVAGDRNSRFLSCKAAINGSNTQTTTASLDLGKYSRLSVFTVSKRLI